MKKYRILAMVLVMLLLSGCGKNKLEIVEQSQQKSVIVVTKAMNSLHWLSVQEGAKDAARDYGVRLQVLWPENESDVEAQDRILEDCIESGCDGVIWAPCNSKKIGKYSGKLLSMGKKLMFMDEEPNTMQLAPYIGVDNAHAGELAASSLSEALRPGSRVAVIGGSNNQKAHYKRTNGFLKFIEDNTDLIVVAAKEVPNATLSGAKTAMKEILQEHPEVQGVFCSSGMMVLGAQEACIAQYRQDVKLVGMDTQSDAMAALAEGKLLAMVSQNAYMLGYMAVKEMVDLLNGQEIKDRYYIDMELVTRERADQYMNEYVMEGRQ